MKNRNLHIAILTDGITPFVTGGMQRHSFHLVNNLLKKGIRITLFHCVYNRELPSNEEVIDIFESNSEKLSVFSYIFSDKSKIPGHYIRASKKYAEKVASDLIPISESIDFIYAKGFSAWKLLKVKKSGVKLPPISVKFHGYEMFQPIDSWTEKIKQIILKPPVRWNNKHADYVFSYGGEISTIIQKLGVSKNKIIDICSGISDEWVINEVQKTNTKRKFLFIGRNERRKGVQDLVALQDTIKNLEAEFYWVGPIPEKSQIISDNCTYFGEIKDASRLKEVIDQCDVLVTPSHSEGMPNVILEAMSRGLAIIATNVGAVSMMVSEKNGILIPPFNNDALSNALYVLDRTNDQKLIDLQKNSLEIVKEKFLWSSIADQYILAILNILDNNG